MSSEEVNGDNMDNGPRVHEEERGNGSTDEGRTGGGGGGGGGMAMPTVFFGNITLNCETSVVVDMFEKQDPPILVERVDMKRGFCFVYLKDAIDQDDKERIQRFVQSANGK